MLSSPLMVLAIASSWSLTTTVDLGDRTTEVSAMLLEIDEERNPIIMRMECKDGGPKFQFEWYGHSGADVIVIEVGEADEDRKHVSFRRDQDSPQTYHLAEDVSQFMERLISYKKPTFLAYYAEGARLWTFEPKGTREAWSRVSAACHR